MASKQELKDRLDRLDVPFNAFGLDKYGISKRHLGRFFETLSFFYRHYFRVHTEGIEHLPPNSRAMLIGNHAGGLPIDAPMVIAAAFLEPEQPRLAHAAVEHFVQRKPLLSQLFARIGQFSGTPENSERLLRDERLVLVFPEGARGSGKLYWDRYELLRFGTGFMRVAMATQTPIIPFGFVGSEEAFPTIGHWSSLAKLLRVPYLPIPLQLLPLPLPVKCRLIFGEPLRFEGAGNESDQVIAEHVERVRCAVASLVDRGLAQRGYGFRDRPECQQSREADAKTTASTAEQGETP
ncbi:MAG: lysophospholipid acyltransferase family protein [Myxococcota bacterium]|jgi:1-acyl-sn-glycerol-3-phosphate acyltransferase|nr:lysophospholipid acyltransferase family protein [Myxococcota bacterium]